MLNLSKRKWLSCVASPQILFFIGLFSLMLLVHWKTISNDILLGYDDDYVVAPMEKVTGISDYISKIKSGEIYDLQPVRDFTFWFDFQIKKTLNIGPHHFTNLMVWTFILILLFSLLVIQKIPNFMAYLLVSMYAFHPCFTNALLWVTARKHLLSTLFILLASYFLIRVVNNEKNKVCRSSKKYLFSICIFYLLSCFSQPINILWPLWAFAFVIHQHNYSLDKLLNKRWIVTSLILLGILVTCAMLNNFYYTKVYVGQSEIAKYVSEADNQISYRLLSIGRSYWQTLVPFWSTPTSYYPGSIQNILGIVLIVIVVWGVYKNRNRSLFIWLLFSVLPILVTTINLTNIFGSDTYILNTGIGMYIIGGLVVGAYSSNPIFLQKRIKYFISAAFIFLLMAYIYLSYQVSSSWQSDLSLFERAVKIETTPFNLKSYIQKLLQKGEYKKSYISAQKLMEWDPYGYNVDQVYASSIYKNPEISIQNKIILLENKLTIIEDSPWLKYYLAGLYASLSKFDKALSIINSIPEKDFHFFKEDMEIVLAEYIFFNQKSGKEYLSIVDKVMKIKNTINGNKWNEQKFLTRLQSLGIDIGKSAHSSREE
ncbi:MAG: hypothetical protein HQK51_20005 [Oligoflexia bacterium]|nr:hypothetical protein [Oligoflexia bacterium]